MVSLTCKSFREFIYIYLIFRKFEIRALTPAVRGFHRTGEVADVGTAREIHPLRRDENFAWDCLLHRLFLMKPGRIGHFACSGHFALWGANRPRHSSETPAARHDAKCAEMRHTCSAAFTGMMMFGSI